MLGTSSENDHYLCRMERSKYVRLVGTSKFILKGDAGHKCIGCGRCADVCHVGLLPYEIARRSENMHYERLQHLSPSDCDGCGACSYICPAGRDVAAEVMEAGKTKGTVFLNWGEDDNE